MRRLLIVSCCFSSLACPADEDPVAPLDVLEEVAEPEDTNPPDVEDVPDVPETIDVAEDVPDIEEVADVPDVEDIEDVEDIAEVDVEPPPPPYWTDLPAGYAQAHFEDLEADGDGVIEDITLALVEGAVSFAVMLEGAPDGVWMRLNKAVVPPGFPVVKSEGTVLCTTCANRVYASQILNTSQFPNTPDVAYKNKGNYKLGAWQFTVTPLGGAITLGPWSGTPLTARILMKLWAEEEPPSAGTIDLNLFFTGAQDITAEVAPEHPRMVAMLEGLADIYGAIGITVGEVRYFDAPEGSPTAIETTVETDSDLATLFSSSADAPPGINVFVVDTIVKTEVEDQSTGIVLGIAGGVPGPPFTHQGSPHSGVALALQDIPADPEGLGAVLAHELGHYLGLFHVINKDDTGFDPIEDTPQDDEDNLMFWAATGATKLTPGQQFVMLRHPSVWLSPSSSEPQP